MPAELNISELKEFLRHVTMRLGESVLISGQPGVGKSVGTYDFCEEEGAFLCDIRLNLYDSVDFRGIPSVKAGMTAWNFPATVPYVGNKNFPTDRPIVLLIDELGSASPSVFPVAMQLINEKACGEFKLMPNVVVVAATNRVSDRGTSVRLPTTVDNRFTHVTVVPDIDAWSDWWIKQGGHPIAVAFYNFRKELFNTFDPTKHEQAFATPRTNAKMWRYWMDDKMPHNIKSAAMRGACGDGVAMEALAFADIWRSVLKIKDILADPEGVPLPSEVSMRYATAVSVSGEMSKKTVPQLAKFLKRLDASYEVLAWTMAVRRTYGTLDSVLTTNEGIDYCRRLQNVYK
jgi:hypothetical protein